MNDGNNNNTSIYIYYNCIIYIYNQINGAYQALGTKGAGSRASGAPHLHVQHVVLNKNDNEENNKAVPS